MKYRELLVCCLAAAAQLAGCVHPGEMDVGLIGQYRRAMAARGPQPRLGEAGLDSLRPAPQEDGPELQLDEIVAREVETARTCDFGDVVGASQQVRVRKVAKTRRFALDRRTGQRDEKTGVAARRVEIDKTCTFQVIDKGGQVLRVPARMSVRTVVFERDAETGKLARAAESEALYTYDVERAKTSSTLLQRIPLTKTVKTTRFWRDPSSGQPVPGLITEATQTFDAGKVIEREVRRVRVPATTVLKTTELRYDPKTQRRTPRTRVDKSVDLVPLTDIGEPPEDTKSAKTSDVTEDRIGRQTLEQSLVEGRRTLALVSLDEAIMRALANNLDIRVVSYDPAISREQMIQAAAVFDWVLYSGSQGSPGLNYAKDEKKPSGGLLGDITRLRQWSLGVRNHTETGADWSLEWSMTRTWDASRVQSLLRTRYEPTLLLQVSQPLLRDAWPEFNRAQLRIARLNAEITDAAFRDRVEEILTEATATYWQLWQTRRRVAIQLAKLKRSRETFRRVQARVGLDATRVNIKQAEAQVRIDEANLIRERKGIRDVQDLLARLLADPQINVLSDEEVVPTTPCVMQRVQINPTEQMLTALRHNPVLEQARLAIAAQRINVRVAENQTLPRLDIVASSRLHGLARTIQQANDKLLTGDYASYGIGLVLEYPIGNRQRLANLRERRYELTKTIVSMQNAADQLAAAVKERIREINTSYQEMRALRTAVEASEVEFQALEDTERIRGQLTPEFLRTKLDAQERLAVAQRAEVQAIVNYNTALAELARATGTVLELHRVEIALPEVVGEPPRPVRRSLPATAAPRTTEPAPDPGEARPALAAPGPAPAKPAVQPVVQPPADPSSVPTPRKRPPGAPLKWPEPPAPPAKPGPAPTGAPKGT
jgi:outer membrane protein